MKLSILAGFPLRGARPDAGQCCRAQARLERTGCALAIEAVFREAGFPEHLFRTVLICSRRVEAAIENSLVRAVTLTGSGPAGRSVASKAGAMLKKTVLGLGGGDRTSCSRTPTSISPPSSAPRDGW